MLVKIVDAPAVGGGRAVVLCDDEEKPLPGQCHTLLECEVGDLPKLTVTFEIDGKIIKLAK